MKSMLAGFAAMILIGVAAYYGLHELGYASWEVYSGPNVRVD